MARSAIINVGEFVFPDVMNGITDASTIRSPAIPRTRSRLSTTARSCSPGPIRQVPTGWKIVVPIAPAASTSSASV